jgi:hypothetical protein
MPRYEPVCFFSFPPGQNLSTRNWIPCSPTGRHQPPTLDLRRALPPTSSCGRNGTTRRRSISSRPAPAWGTKPRRDSQPWHTALKDPTTSATALAWEGRNGGLRQDQLGFDVTGGGGPAWTCVRANPGRRSTPRA